MDFNEAKNALKEGYTQLGLEFLHERDNETFFRYRRGELVITGEDIKEYAEFEARRHDYMNAPSECSICSRNYREHAISRIDRFRIPLSYTLREHNVVFGELSSDNVYAEIGPASKEFYNYLRFEPN